jgi:hypothetical protein
VLTSAAVGEVGVGRPDHAGGPMHVHDDRAPAA